MKIFNKVVLSETEPENISDFWLRDNVDPKKMTHSKSLWWFTPEGWKKLFDFDTRYNVSWNFDYETQSDFPMEVSESYDVTTGIDTVNNTVYIYDATRDIENNENLVNEIGLKWHVDDLQKKIDALAARVSQNEKDIASLKSRASSLEDSVKTLVELTATINQSINNLDSRVSALESE